MSAVDALEAARPQAGRADGRARRRRGLRLARSDPAQSVPAQPSAACCSRSSISSTQPRIVGETDSGARLGRAARDARRRLSSSSCCCTGARRARRSRLMLQFGADLTAITLLMHASGGISSGLGGMLVVSVGTLALAAGNRARVPARRARDPGVAAASRRSRSFEGMTTSAQVRTGGILGAVIFVITAVVQLLRNRIVETEALAEQRGLDLAQPRRAQRIHHPASAREHRGRRRRRSRFGSSTSRPRSTSAARARRTDETLGGISAGSRGAARTRGACHDADERGQAGSAPPTAPTQYPTALRAARRAVATAAS